MNFSFIVHHSNYSYQCFLISQSINGTVWDKSLLCGGRETLPQLVGERTGQQEAAVASLWVVSTEAPSCRRLDNRRRAGY